MDFENWRKEDRMSRYCPSCHKEVDYLSLVKDCYGIPYKYVCEKCYDKTRAELRDDYAELGMDDPFEPLPENW